VGGADLPGARVAQYVRGAVGAPAALRGDAELELQAFEADGPVGHGLADLMVGYPAAHANNHFDNLSTAQDRHHRSKSRPEAGLRSADSCDYD
jgi:hypothetical protein